VLPSRLILFDLTFSLVYGKFLKEPHTFLPDLCWGKEPIEVAGWESLLLTF
jgi:hypothetical protein